MGSLLQTRHLTRAFRNSYNGRCLISMMRFSSAPKQYPGLEFSWPFPDFRKPHKGWEFKSRITVFFVGMGGKTWISLLNRTKVLNKEILTNAVYKRPPGVPLITVANHESCMDDPALIGVALSPMQMCDQKNMRWSLAAHDICYTRKFYSHFFSYGKCIPCVRGQGVYQKSIDFTIERLNEFGDWLHIFPEGRVNMERENLYRFKWGIGRIISELKTTPIVIPFYHTGMPDILPNYRPYIPRVGKTVFMNVGQPLNMKLILEKTKNLSARDKRKAITDFIQEEMEKLRIITLKLSDEYKRGVLNV